MNEVETRAEHIDPALKTSGWGVVEGSRIRHEYSIGFVGGIGASLKSAFGGEVMRNARSFLHGGRST